MWVNPLFDASHRASALDLVRANPLATLIVGDPVRVSHMPVLLEQRADGTHELVGHMPRVDPASDGLIAGANTIVVFHGASSYISPAWYVAPGLPTYNYLVAHLEGPAQVMTDSEELRRHLLDLTAVHEELRAVTGISWTPDEVAHARMDMLMPQIIGFRVPVSRFQVKTKLGQNRSIGDQRSAAAALHTSPDTADQVIAECMDASSEERSST
ncbi:FMN-binding negative transcriptional regulator [Georgenia sp. MJ170]|uniref:FMN-binding negative transcriptional regulator n=1 Tax=Georgenia sunbinii TaxID=3117728 RepID=UPI002F26795B